MHAFSASELLTVWERGAGSTPVRQALAILSVALPEVPDDALATLNVVQRDLCLLRLRALTFGSRFEGLTECPACYRRLELDFDANDLPASATPLPDLDTIKPQDPEISYHLNDYEVTFRLPNSLDLITLDGARDRVTGRQQLLEACIISTQNDHKAIGVSELPSEVLNGVAACMSQTDPLADLTLPATCPACGHNWEIIFDIVSFFWSEINSWSIRLIRQVHTLAMAYGWRETEILAMSAWRRQQYLELIGV